MAKVSFPYQYFPDPTRGKPLFNGSIYIGTAGTDPEVTANQIQAYAVTESGDIAVPQPLKTGSGGVVMYGGSAVGVRVDADSYSIKMLDANGSQVYYAANFSPGSTLAEAQAAIDTDVTNRLVEKFASVASLKLASLPSGQRVSTRSYYAQDIAQGGAEYDILTLQEARDAKGNPAWVPDGYSDHYLANGNVAALQEWKDLRPFGVANALTDRDALQAAITRIKTSSTNEVLDCEYTQVLLDEGVTHNQGDSGIENLTATADAAFSSPATDEAMLHKKTGLRMDYSNIDLQCSGVANGLWNESGGFGSHYHNIEIDGFKSDGYGAKFNGSGDQSLSSSLITGDAEVANRGTSVAVDVPTGDFKLYNCIIRYADIPLRISNNTFHGTGNHIYNGDAGSATPATDSNGIVVNGGSGQSMCHTYLDKGRVVLDGFYDFAMFDTKLLFNSTPQHASVVHMKAQVANREWPDGFVWDGCKSTIPLHNGNMAFVTLEDDAGNWDAEAQTIAAEINRIPGVPRIVGLETAHYVPASMVVVSKSDEQRVKHSIGANTFVQNTSNACNEVWRSQEHAITAAGLTDRSVADGTSTDVQYQLDGSRTNFGLAAKLSLRNRKGSSIWDDTNGSAWNIGVVGRLAADTDDLLFQTKDVGGTITTNRLRFRAKEDELRPEVDNSTKLGTASNRWSEVFAATGTINTSDADTKQQVRDLSVAEKAVAVKCKGLLKAFKFNDAVERKGNGARIHFGIIAQDLKAAFESEGLVAEDYAVLCYDEWEDEYDHVVVSEAIVDEDGNEIEPEVVEKVLVTPAGGRYGVRYEELMAFIIAAI